MNRLTVMPFLLAMFVAVAGMPTNVFQICAWDVGTLALEPWKQTSAAVQRVSAGIRAWLASIWSPRLAFACLAALLAIMLAMHGNAEGVVLAIVPVSGPVVDLLQTQRARLLREAEALKGADGQFANDLARRDFDAKMSEVESIDIALRGQSEFVVERTMLDDATATSAPRMTMADPPEPNDNDLGRRAERERVQGIMAAVKAARLPVSFAERLIANGELTLVDAQRQVFDEMGRREPAAETRSQVPNVEMGVDPFVHARAGIENAILHRLAPDHFKLEDSGRNYRGMTMIDIARAYLQAKGVRTTDLSKMKLAGAALGLVETRTSGMHTTSDFAYLLADVANKTLRRAYEERPQTFAPLGRRVTIPDYKPVRRLQLGDAPDLLEIKEHGEYKSGTIGEGKEQYQLAKYGRKFAITREALINDDTDAFSRVPMNFGRKARSLESNLVWEQITSNPVMGDGTTLFHADHGNVAAVASAISIDSLGEARAALRGQTSIDGEHLNLSARSLVVPPSEETLADQFVTVIQAQQAGQVNPFQGKLVVIAEPRLETASNIAWYVFASPDQVDIFEFGYLEGEEGPQVESRVGFDVDGLEIKCRLDFAAKVIDWRGIFRNLGAS